MDHFFDFIDQDPDDLDQSSKDFLQLNRPFGQDFPRSERNVIIIPHFFLRNF